ncbi:MAG: HAD superfamily hydrolase (TIGR01509 family) [Pseudorhodobacter sp.]|jgi:HAD superfamily hydrolase (TIGR01509 family)
MTPRAILFDCDGVLVDSETATMQMLITELAAHGLPLTRAKAEHLFLGGTIKGLFATARQLGATLPDDWIDDFYHRLYARLRQGTELIHGVAALLDRLDAAGIRYAVGSNGSDQKMQITLGQHPEIMARLHPHLYSGQTLGCPKPDPGLWLHAAAALGVAPENCAVVDDSPVGCTAAARANIPCFGLAEHDDGHLLAATGASVIHRLADLPALIGL